MLIIGLTGASGAGKGLFGKTAKEAYGALHIDTDLIAREVVEPGKPCLDDLRQHFGTRILREDGTLNRAALGNIVFSDPAELAVLNRITHHYVTDEVRRILACAEKDGVRIAIVDAPLLFESGEDAICDVTVGVVADQDTRLRRIMQRDGIDLAAAKKRLAAGKDTAFFCERCDYILENNADAASFAEKAAALLQTLAPEIKPVAADALSGDRSAPPAKL